MKYFFNIKVELILIKNKQIQKQNDSVEHFAIHD